MNKLPHFYKEYIWMAKEKRFPCVLETGFHNEKIIYIHASHKSVQRYDITSSSAMIKSKIQSIHHT